MCCYTGSFRKLIKQGFFPSDLPLDPTIDLEARSRSLDLEQQVGALITERDSLQRNMEKLESENRKLVDIAAKLAAEFDRRASSGLDVGMTALVWDLQISQRDLASERKISCALWQTIENQAYRITMQEREIAQLKSSCPSE